VACLKRDLQQRDEFSRVLQDGDSVGDYWHKKIRLLMAVINKQKREIIEQSHLIQGMKQMFTEFDVFLEEMIKDEPDILRGKRESLNAQVQVNLNKFNSISNVHVYTSHEDTDKRMYLSHMFQ
jgi:hypothetical protein